MKVRIVAGAVVAIMIVGVAAFFLQRAAFSGGGDAEPTPARLGDVALDGVSQQELSDHGIHLSGMSRSYAPQVSDAKARQVAAKRDPNVDIRQMILADFVSDADPSRTMRHVWIVNFDINDPDLFVPQSPVGGPPTPGDKYALSFVDADVAEIVDRIIVTGPPGKSPAP